MSFKGMLLKAGISSNGEDVETFRGHLKLTGRSETPGATAVRVHLVDNDGKVLLASGTTVPTAGEAGFAKGCLFIKTDAASGTRGLYENLGTSALADFSNEIKQTMLDRRLIFEEFNTPPVAQKRNGGAAGGTTGDENILIFPENIFEYHILGAGQTITVPTYNAAGLDISLDQADDEGCEITNGINGANLRAAFTVGTDPAFYAKCKFSIADVSGTDDCAFGFRKAEAYQANIDDYDEMFCLNVIGGNITREAILNGAATDSDDTDDDWADGETHTLEVYVSADGVCTCKIDGADPSTAPSAFTFDDGEVVVPFFYFLHDSDVAGAVVLKEWEVGLQ